ncbi:MAG: YIP1 family protein [DPANN group archaeon]|nr:YIP1 family protein [DPANN group archaeon]
MAIEDFVDNVKGFIAGPGRQFERVRKHKLADAMVYGLIGLFIYGLLSSTLMAFSIAAQPFPFAAGTGGLVFIIMLLAVWLGGFLGTIIGSLWIHLWAYLFGARGLDKTIAIQFYANTPTYLLGWIPVVNFFTGIWSIVLLGIGLMKVHKLTTGQAIGTILIAIIIPVIIIMIIVGLAFLSYASAVGGGYGGGSSYPYY